MGFWNGVLNIVSSIPVVGHVTAGVQYMTGDKEAAQKSLASSTGNLVGTLGAVGGFFVGGPVGAAAGGAAGSAIGGQIERKINGQDLDLSAGTLLTDAALGGASGMLGGGSLHSVGKELSETLGKTLAGSMTNTAVVQTAGQVVR